MTKTVSIVTVYSVYLLQLALGTMGNIMEKNKTYDGGLANGRVNSLSQLDRKRTQTRGLLELQYMTATRASLTRTINVTMITSVAVMWTMAILAALMAFLLGSTKSRKDTQWWEYLVFGHLYFNIASFMALYIPQGIQSVEGFGWIVNGLLAGFISLLLSAGLATIYSKVIINFYANFPEETLWCIVRFVFITVVLLSGFAAGGLVIMVAFNTTVKAGYNWLYAVGVIIALYTVVVLPIVCVAVCVLDTDDEKDKRNRNRRDKYRNSDRDTDRYRGRAYGEDEEGTPGSSHASQVSEGSGHIRAILEGHKGDSQPLTARRSPSKQSTGSDYFQHLMDDGNVSKVKSISQYGSMAASTPKSPTAPASPPTALRSSPVLLQTPSTASPSAKKTSSEQSTGSDYYRMLMQGNVPKVKSISQYGALLGQGPK